MPLAAVIGLALSALVLARCSSTPRPAMDPDSEKFYETARLIMSKEEKDVFNHLPDPASRQEFIQEFWDKRDPDPETPENEFKTEFYDRLEYARLHFREGGRGWNTDRGRIYIFLGPPDRTEEFQPVKFEGQAQRGPVLWWSYYRYNLAIQFLDKYNNGKYVMEEFEGELSLALEKAELGYLGRTAGVDLKYLDFDFEYNRERGEASITLPVKAFNFKAEEGRLKADVDFLFYIYEIGKPRKEKVQKSAAVSEPEAEMSKKKRLTFTVPLDLKPGNYYVDIIVTSSGLPNKTRKIFTVKV